MLLIVLGSMKIPASLLYWVTVICLDRMCHVFNSVDQSRGVALQKLWMYLTSLVSGSVFRWSLVITRFGKPGNSEIRGLCWWMVYYCNESSTIRSLTEWKNIDFYCDHDACTCTTMHSLTLAACPLDTLLWCQANSNEFHRVIDALSLSLW